MVGRYGGYEAYELHGSFNQHDQHVHDYSQNWKKGVTTGISLAWSSKGVPSLPTSMVLSFGVIFLKHAKLRWLVAPNEGSGFFWAKN